MSRMGDAEAQEREAQRSHDEAEKRADALATEVDAATARATTAAAEAERAAADRSAAEREAASWAAEAHRLRRSVQAAQLKARRHAEVGEDASAAPEGPSEAELQAQIQTANEAREGAARRAAEHASIEREAAQRAAVARAAVNRLTAARSQAARTAAEQAQRQEDARDRIQTARVSVERTSAERKSAQTSLKLQNPAAGDASSGASRPAARGADAPAPVLPMQRTPAPDLAVPDPGAAQLLSTRLLENAAPDLSLSPLELEAVQPLPGSTPAERSRGIERPDLLQSPLPLERVERGAAPEHATVLRFDRNPRPAQEPAELEELPSGRRTNGSTLYTERSSGWEKQASLAAAEMAAQESARVSRELARERAERLEHTAANARSLLEMPDVPSSQRWILAAAAAIATVGSVAFAGVWLSRDHAGSEAPTVAAAQISRESATRGGGEERGGSSDAPRREAEHKPAWLRNAAPAAALDGRPLVAIVVDDMGMDEQASAQVINLPSPLTISFLPASPRLGRQVEAARARGHEVLAHVPMEPRGLGNDPGPNYLGVIHSKEELRARLSWNLNQLTGIVGINNHMGSLFTRSAEGMRMVMEELRNRELLFLDSRTTQQSIGAEVAAEEGIPYSARDVFLDDERDAGRINDRLAEIETIARKRGSAVAIGHPLRATIDALEKWLAQADKHGVQVVPLSAVVQQQMAQRQQRSRTTENPHTENARVDSAPSNAGVHAANTGESAR